MQFFTFGDTDTELGLALTPIRGQSNKCVTLALDQTLEVIDFAPMGQ